MYQQSNQLCSVDEQPECQRLLEAIRSDVFILSELTTTIGCYANNLKPISRNVKSPENAISNQEKEADGITGLLWKEIFRLRSQISEIETISIHLRDVIGS